MMDLGRGKIEKESQYLLGWEGGGGCSKENREKALYWLQMCWKRPSGLNRQEILIWASMKRITHYLVILAHAPLAIWMEKNRKSKEPWKILNFYVFDSSITDIQINRNKQKIPRSFSLFSAVNDIQFLAPVFLYITVWRLCILIRNNLKWRAKTAQPHCHTFHFYQEMLKNTDFSLLYIEW